MKGIISIWIILILLGISNTIFSQALKIQHDLVVAKDGSGDYKYIQDAIDAVRVYLPKRITIRIKKGIYKEKINVPSTLSNITFVGEEGTIISYDDFSGKGKMDTFDSYTMRVMGNDIVLENLVIENTAGKVGQAVALHIEGDRCLIRKCKLLGNQDTIFASGENSRQHFVECYIEGTVDFIFGSSTALFEKCQIHSKSNGYISAASTPKWVKFGYVFKNCQLTADTGINEVYLGRPWRSYAKTVFIDCQLGKHILPLGWDNWANKENEKTSYYAEFNNIGEGANINQRVSWSHLLSPQEVSEYTTERILSGETISEQKKFWQQASFIGVTGLPDLGYTTSKAYEQSKKTNPETDWISDEKIKNVEEKHNITYRQIGNRKLELDAFFIENNPKKLKTAILIIHGGGWRTGNRSQHHPMARHLAAKGYVCFTPEYRLSTEALYPAAIFDLKDAIKWVKKHAASYQIDSNKVVVLGFSAGGELAAFLGVTANNPNFEETADSTSTKVSAVVDIDGIVSFVHPESGEGDDSKQTSAATHWFGFSKKDNPTLWTEASSLTYVGKNSPPILFLNSSVERMHAGRDDFRNILDSYQIYSEVHTFDNAPHSFCLFKPWFEPTLKYIDAFIKKIH